MALSQNSFKQVPVKGQKYRDTGDTISVRLFDADPDKEYEAGEAVILVDSKDVISVTAGADATAEFVGTIVSNQLREKFKSGDMIEIVMLGGEVLMEASAAVTAGVACEYDPASKKCVGASSGKALYRAMTSAAADGDLFVAKQILG